MDDKMARMIVVGPAIVPLICMLRIVYLSAVVAWGLNFVAAML